MSDLAMASAVSGVNAASVASTASMVGGAASTTVTATATASATSAIHAAPSAMGVLCLILTIVLYFLVKRLYGRYPKIWLMPLISVPVVAGAALLATKVPFPVYYSDTRWLLWLLGPATIAYALPIYEFRGTIRRHALSLSIGVTAGIVTGIVGSFLLAKLLALPPDLQRALAIRSVSTPFALAVAQRVDAPADIVAVLVIVTGLAGILLGQLVMSWLPLRTRIARGALFGAGAHGVGTATARTLGREEGMIASLTMTISGVVMVLIAPMVAWVLG